jgi:hypothetical protein
LALSSVTRLNQGDIAHGTLSSASDDSGKVTTWRHGANMRRQEKRPRKRCKDQNHRSRRSCRQPAASGRSQSGARQRERGEITPAHQGGGDQEIKRAIRKQEEMGISAVTRRALLALDFLENLTGWKILDGAADH